MSAVKKIGVVIFLIIMLISECMLMGIFAVDFGASKPSVKSAIQDSGIVVELTSEALAKNTVNNAGEYGEEIQAVMRSKAMTSFFTDYISTGIKSLAYGREYEEIATNEMIKAFRKGVSQVNRAGTYDIDSNTEELFVRAMKRSIPDLTMNLEDMVQMYQATTIARTTADPDQIEEGKISIQNMMAPIFRVLLIGIILGAMIMILLLAMKKGKSAITRGGAVVLGGSALSTLLFAGIAYLSSIKEPVDAMSIFCTDLVTNGAIASAVCGAVCCLIIFIVLIYMKLKARKFKKAREAKKEANRNTMELSPEDMQLALDSMEDKKQIGDGKTAKTPEIPAEPEVPVADVQPEAPAAEGEEFVEVPLADASDAGAAEETAPILEVEPPKKRFNFFGKK